MELHRVKRQDDWEEIPKAKRSFWQTKAAQTQGWVTPGNIISLTGLLIVSVGLLSLAGRHYWVGLLLVGIGRLADIFDGLVADRTATKSHVGEAVDASIDKLELLFALVVLLILDILPLWALIGVVIVNLAIGCLSIWATAQGKRLHPSRTGKLATAGQWVAVGGYVLTEITTRSAWSVVASGVLIVSLIACAIAFGMYIAVLKRERPSSSSMTN